MLRDGLKRRAERAIERQLEYQQKKAAKTVGREERVISSMVRDSARVRGRLEAIRPIAKHDRVLEVGSGGHGLIFFFGTDNPVGVDPLADHYRTLFPKWQHQAHTIAAGGEDLPFEDDSFDVVLCENVVDHAEDPGRILREIARVMAPGAILYFGVNVHHRFYSFAASVHAMWRALGIGFEVTPFADHTYHFTLSSARALFDGLPLRRVQEADNIQEEICKQRSMPSKQLGDLPKRLFFKNAVYETIALKD